MASFSIESDSHSAQIQYFIDLSEKSFASLAEIQASLIHLDKEGSESKKKLKEVLIQLKEVLDVFQKTQAQLENLKNQNDVWRSSLILEMTNFMEDPNQLAVMQDPVHGIGFENAKWPSDSSTEAHQGD